MHTSSGICQHRYFIVFSMFFLCFNIWPELCFFYESWQKIKNYEYSQFWFKNSSMFFLCFFYVFSMLIYLTRTMFFLRIVTKNKKLWIFIVLIKKRTMFFLCFFYVFSMLIYLTRTMFFLRIVTTKKKLWIFIVLIKKKFK